MKVVGVLSFPKHEKQTLVYSLDFQSSFQGMLSRSLSMHVNILYDLDCTEARLSGKRVCELCERFLKKKKKHFV